MSRAADFVYRDTFFGRQSERAELVSGGATITTIVGPAGCGKTRLAIESASQSGLRFTVVTFADFASATHAVSVESLVADAAEEADGVDLVILDDCDHALPALVELLPALLSRRSDIRFWITARERLSVPGERVIRLAPLSEAEAVDLILERVGWKDRVTDLIKSGAAQIANLLDCMPLALEIAAGRLRLLGFAELEARLADDLLDLRSRKPLERHRSLEAALDWSWQLLTDVERSVLCQLSSFSGGFSVEAAEAVARIDAEPPMDKVEIFEKLIERSLVLGRGLAGEAQTLALYTSVSAYARRRLEAEPTLGPGVHERHRAYFAQLAKRSRSGSSVVRLATFSQNYDVVLGNVISACEASINTYRIIEAADLLVFASAAGSSARMLFLIEPLTRVIDHPRFGQIPVADQVALLGLRGKYHFCANDDGPSVVDHRQALALAEANGLTNQRAYLTMGLGLIASSAAIDGPATDLLVAARELAVETGELGLLEAIDFCRASRAFEGELELAENLCTNIALASDARGDAATRAVATVRLAYVDLLRNELGMAADKFARAGATFEQLREIQYLAVCRRGLGMIEHLAARFAPALDHYRASVKLLFRRPSSRYLAISLALEAAAECALGDQMAGRRLFDELAKRRQSVSPVDQAAVAVYRLHRDPRAIEDINEATDRVTEPSARGYEFRLARRLLQVLVDQSKGPTLAVAANCAVVTMRGKPSIEFGNRATPRRLLDALVRKHENEPGAVVTSEELIGVCWPDERIIPDAARNRLRVAISALRRLGLEEIVETAPGGYRLPHNLRIDRNQ